MADEETFQLHFLGTGGARHVMADQDRSTGGLLLSRRGTWLSIDPGPGALVKMRSMDPPFDPGKLSGIILTHGHIDHCNDINLLVDAMTRGGLYRRGTLFAPREALQGEGTVLYHYLRSYPREVVELESLSTYSVDGVQFFTSGPHLHGRETYGLLFPDTHGILSLVADTKYFSRLQTDYRGCRWMVLNLTVEKSSGPGVLHLDIQGAKKLIQGVEPDKVWITHFGKTILKLNPERVAMEISKSTGIPVFAACDGDRITLQADKNWE